MYTGDTPRINVHSGSAAQKFQLKQIDATTFTFFTVCSGYNTTLTADSNGTAVTTTYHSGNDYQKWVLEPAYDATQKAVSIGGEFFLESDKDYEQYADVKESSRAFRSMGYDATYTMPSNMLDFYTSINTKEIIHFSCHGGPDGLQYEQAVNATGSKIVGLCMEEPIGDENWYLYNIDLSSLAWDNCKLVIFDSCSAYLPGDNNDICDIVVNSGAQVALGWDHAILAENLHWFEEFYDYLLRGKTVAEAVSLMNTKHQKYGNEECCSCDLEQDCLMYDAKLVGNGNFRLFATN